MRARERFIWRILSAGLVVALGVPAYAQSAGSGLPSAPGLGQPPAPPPQQQPRLRVLMSPSVASPMLLLPETGNGYRGGGVSGAAGNDNPSPSSGSKNLYPQTSVPAPADGAQGEAAPSGSTASSAPSGESATGKAPATDQPAYNPRPFLASMVRLRLTANTCESFLPTSPVQDTSQIEDFFTSLKREPPDGELSGLRDSLDLLVRSQAASICQNRMNTALAAYQRDAQVYDAKKPQAWPAAPVVKPVHWCATPNCIEVK